MAQTWSDLNTHECQEAPQGNVAWARNVLNVLASQAQLLGVDNTGSQPPSLALAKAQTQTETETEVLGWL